MSVAFLESSMSLVGRGGREGGREGEREREHYIFTQDNGGAWKGMAEICTDAEEAG